MPFILINETHNYTKCYRYNYFAKSLSNLNGVEERLCKFWKMYLILGTTQITQEQQMTHWKYENFWAIKTDFTQTTQN